MRFVLASKSPRRKVLLRHVIPTFEVAVIPVTEEAPRALDVAQAVEVIAKKKALAASREHPDAVVIAGDTVVTYRQELIGKAHTPAEARMRLAMLSGETHEVVTGLALAHRERAIDGESCTSRVRMDRIPKEVLEEYIGSGAWRGKAGGYGIQDPLLGPYLHVDGSWSNVVGLPLATLHALLTRNEIPCQEPPSEGWLRDHNPFVEPVE